MAKEQAITLKGCRVIEIQRNGYFVETETNQKVLCKLSGKMQLNLISVIVGDKVTIEVSPYDLTRGRIMFREKV